MRMDSFSRRLQAATPVATLFATMLFVGCTDQPGAENASPKPTTSAEAHDDHDHGHASEGPHHGSLIELGNEAYHAELVHSDDGAVTIYILDGSAKTAVPIEAEDVTVNLTHGETAEQFKLPAKPDTSDPSGKSSRFELRDEELASDLDAEGANARLVVTIDGKQFTGKIAHDHDHGHEH